MKKFLGKLPVMITLVSLAVVMLVAYIVMLVRPVAYGFTYKGKEDLYGTGKKQEITMKFNNDKYARTTIKGEEDETIVDAWIYRDGKYIAPVGGTFKKVVKASETDKVFLEKLVISEDAYDEMVKTFKEAKKEHPEEYKEELKESGYKVNAFTMTIGEGKDAVTYTCTGSIVFAAVGGVVLVALLTFGAFSVVYFIKGKKKA
ncbi:MAG: hypothetical protein IKA36_01310 [Clostridia bacterium]|nr:hypothetical protein [Clostridia bacterium]